MRRRTSLRFEFVPCLIIALIACTGSVFAQDLQPRPLLRKDAVPALDWRHLPDMIAVKFLDDLPIRASSLHDAAAGRAAEVLHDMDTGLLDELRLEQPLLAARGWHAAIDVEPARLAELRDRARTSLGRDIADPRSEFIFRLPEGVDAQAAITALNRLEIVELASPMVRPAPMPRTAEGAGGAGDGGLAGGLPPNFATNQGYGNDAPTGIGATSVWQTHGVRGAGVRVADIEYNFNADHADLPDVTILTVGTPTPPWPDDNHGTAVLGMLGAIDNDWGITGMVPDALLHFSHSRVNGVINIANAIYRCIDAFDAGDVILVEAQTWGPNSINFPPDCFGCVPVEWEPATYTAVVIAVGNGIVVVQAGGNGQQNLDDPIYTQGNGGHYPFAPGNDSGSIIVGAGHAPVTFGGSNVPRSRMWYSNYGSRLDLQGWGQAVWTTGYGGAFNALGPNFWYTGTFGGTSSASPIVAAAATLLQSHRFGSVGAPLSPDQLRSALVATGTPQTTGQFPASQKIGPLPDVMAAIALTDILDCPESASDEGEVCGSQLNAGCDSDPHVFGAIACGETICGTVWAQGGTRDTDWYEITLIEPTEVTFSGTAEFPLRIGLVATGGVPDCDLATTLEPFADAEPFFTATFTACLEPGTYWFFVSTTLFDGLPCGAENLYVVTLACNVCETGACDASADVVVTHSNSAIANAGQVACGVAGITTEGQFARSFNLGSGSTAGQDYLLTCVDFGYFNNGAPIAASLNVYIDTNGAAPVSPSIDLSLIGSVNLLLDTSPATNRLINLPEPICVPVNSFLVIELDIAASISGFASIAGNTAGFSAPTYFRAAPCGVVNYVTYASIGFPDANWALTLFGRSTCAENPSDPCPWDLSVDGIVDDADLGTLLDQWGPCPGCPADLNDDGFVDGADLGALLNNWGPCP